eukprot:10157472-Lingulodinium_polyedra.AAC.1
MLSEQVLNLSIGLQRSKSCANHTGLQDVAETAIQFANDYVLFNSQRSKCGHDPKCWWRFARRHARWRADDGANARL